MQVELHDNGQGADHVAGDGLYAKFFLDFLPNQVERALSRNKAGAYRTLQAKSKRYGLSCKVEGTNETKVNHGPNNAMREVCQN